MRKIDSVIYQAMKEEFSKPLPKKLADVIEVKFTGHGIVLDVKKKLKSKRKK